MRRITDIFDNITARQFWRFIGEGVTNRIRSRVRNQHRNVKGQRFSAYSENYAKYKRRGMQKLSGGKLARYKGKSIASRSTTPDMTLTGNTMDALTVHQVTKRQVEVGWAGEFAGIVEGLHGTKNFQIVNLDGDPPFATAEMDWIDDEINGALDKGIREYTKEDIVINVDGRSRR